MSDTVDTRVVRMEFDNRQFEKNIKKTSQSLNNLKQNLDFDGVGDSIDEVKLKISALEITATTFIANIANRLTNLSIHLVKSLSVDNIWSGWAKFGDKTVSVATMMAQKIRIAGKEITDVAEKTEVVTDKLAALNWFSDETSYSFNDMVDNVGKFTAAGQDLDKSVEAMEGIATWAALSGQNASTASRAMYQLAQAMGKGKIQLIDWKSIQNANMDTEEFREKILETAVSMKELTKEGDQFVTKTGKKFTQSQFAEQLSEGWFTSDVLIKGLGKYSSAIDEIYSIASKEDLTASDVIEKYGDQLDPFGVKAFKAAQEARTFSDALESVRDAVSSKWLGTFETIFGNKTEAVQLWTDLANELYDVFAESGNFRNDILSVWKSMGGRDDLFARGGDNQGAFWNIYDAIISVRDLIRSAWNTVFPLSELEDYSAQTEDIGNKIKGITTRMREFTSKLQMSEATSSRISKIFQGLFNILKIGMKTVKGFMFVLDPLIVLGKELVNQVLDQIIFYGSKLFSVGSKLENIFVTLQNLLVDLLYTLDINSALQEVFNLINKIFNVIADYKPITRLVNHVKEFISALRSTTDMKSDFSNFIDIFKKSFSLVSKLLYQVVSLFFELMPIMSKVLGFAFKMLGYIAGVLSKMVGLVSKIISSVINFLAESGLVNNLKNSVMNFLTNVYEVLKPVLQLIIKAGSIIGSFIKNILLAIPNVLNVVTKAVENSNILNILSDILLGVIDVVKEFIKNSGKISGNIAGGFAKSIQALFAGLLTFVKGLIPVLQITFTVFGRLLDVLGTIISKVANTILNVLTGKDIGKFLKIVALLLIVVTTFKTIYYLIWTIKKTIMPISTLVESISDVSDAIYTKLKAGAFNDIADFIMKVTASLALLSTIDEHKLIQSIAAVTIVLGVMLGVMAVIDKMSKITKVTHRKSKNIKQSIIGIIDQVRDNMSYRNILIESIESLVDSLLKASIAILLLSKIPERDVYRASFIAITLLASMAGIVTFAGNNVKASSIKKMPGLLRNISKVTVMLIGIALAMKLLSNSAPSGVASASAGITASLLGMLGIITVLNKFKMANKRTQESLTMLQTMTKSMILVAVALRIAASKDIGSSLTAVTSMTAVVYAMAGLVYLLKNKLATSKSVELFNNFAKSLIPFSFAMVLLSSAIKNLGSMNPAYVWNGMAAIAAFTTVTLYVGKLGKKMKSFNFGKFSASLIAMAIAMQLMSGVILTLSVIQPNKVWNGVAAINAFVALAACTSKLTKNMNSMNFALLSATLILFAQAMLLMSGSIAILGSMEFSSIAKAIVAISAFAAGMVMLADRTAASGSMWSLMALSLGMTAFAISVIPFISALLLMGNINFKSLALGLLTVAGSIMVVAGLAIALEPIIGGILALSSAMLMAGIGMLAMGLGLTILATGLEAIAIAFTAGFESIKTIIVSFSTMMLEIFMNSIQIVIDRLVEILPSIFDMFSRIIDSLIELITVKGPEIASVVLTVIDNLLQALVDHGDSIFDSVFSIILMILQRLVDNIGPIADSLFKIFLGLFDKLTEYIPAIVGRIMKFIGVVLTSVLGNITALAGMIAKVILVLLSAAIRIVIASLGTLGQLFIELIASTLLMLMHIFIGMTNVVYELVKTAMYNIMNVISKVLTEVGPMMIDLGGVFIKSLLAGLLTSLAKLVEDIPVLKYLSGPLNDWADDLGKSANKGMNSAILSGMNVTGAVKTATNNIQSTIKTSNALIADTAKVGINEITSAVSDSVADMSGALSTFGKEAGGNLLAGIDEGTNGETAKSIGAEIGTQLEAGYSEATETHSPSRVFRRFGQYLMEGLSLGIGDESSVTSNAITDVIGNSLQLANDIISDQAGDDLIIKVGMDISGVEEQSSRIQDIMSGVNNPNITPAGYNADYTSRMMNKTSKNNGINTPSTTNNNSNDVTYNNTFNISSTDPSQSAEEIDKVLQQQAMRRKLAHGS